jgi:hypothetical protein
MDPEIEARIYPPHLKTPFAARQIRFARTLGSMLLRSSEHRNLRLFLMFASPRPIRRMAWARYVQPDPAFTPPAASTRVDRDLAALRRDGVIRVERDFSALADYVRERYLSADWTLAVDDTRRKNGLEVSHAVSFADERLHELFFDADLCALVCRYYGRQAFYRDNPTVHKELTRPESTPLISGVFHSDGYRQISFMLLLNDLAISDTHMEYAKGSHAQQQPSYERNEIDQAAVAREFEIVHLIGPKGTLYVFDAEGLHRGAYHRGGQRQMLHVNITTGTLPFTDEKYDALSAVFRDPPRVPPHVREFLRGATR